MAPTEAVSATALPKHAQLSSRLRREAAQLGPGASLESERSLMERFGVSRTTVRRAIADLVAEGVLESAQGRGTFVARQRVQTQLHLASFTEDMRRRGRVPSTTLLGAALLPAPAEVVQHFGGVRQAWRLERLRLADGEPLAHEVEWVNAQLAPDLGERDLRGSMYSLLGTEYGCPVDAAEQTLWAEPATEQTAAHLTIATGAPVLVFDRLSSSAGRPLELVRSWYRADRYRLHMNLDRSMPA